MSTPTENSHGTLASYTIGFALSLALTLLAYYLVVNHLFSTDGIVGTIITLGIIQLFVQLIFFLHLDRGSNRRWNLTVLSFAAIVVIILVFGSLWIMHHLDYNMQSGQSLSNQIMNSEAIQK